MHGNWTARSSPAAKIHFIHLSICDKGKNTMTYACKVSVIIPVFNMAKYLDQTIASWTGQTLKDIEVICIDDGSTDDSLRKLEDMAKSDSRIRLFSFSTNKGPWAARNYGVEEAAGQYILFADADDTVLPETCEDLVREMDKAQADILHFTAEVRNPNDLPEQEIADNERWLAPYNGLRYGKDVITLCFKERKIGWTLWNKMFKAGLCKKVLSDIIAAGLQDAYVRIAEDALLYFMLSFTAQSYKGIHGKKYYQYNFGLGGFGHQYYTLPYFKNICMEAQVSLYMKAFLESHDALDAYEDIYSGTRQAFLTKELLKNKH